MENNNFSQLEQSYHPKHHIKVYVWIALVVASFLMALNGYFYFLNLEQGATPMACTMEAKLCPDGTAVGRTGPNCEFAKCPRETDTSAWKTYRNEEYGFEVKTPQDWHITQDDSDIEFYSAQTWMDLESLSGSEKIGVGVSPDFTFRLDRERPENPYAEKSILINNVNFVTYTAIGYPDTEYLYFETTKAEKIFSFVSWTSRGKDSLPQIISTFKFIEPTAGQFCGGIAGTVCPAGYDCKLDGNYPDAGGTCVQNSNTGILTGQVTIGPNCPVEREGVVCTPSPEAYASREFIVLDSNQKEITRFHADTSGNYSLTLSPGAYTIVSANTGMGFMSSDLPATVTIKAGQSTTLNIDIDTGIR